MTDHDYNGRCQACNYCMDSQTYQAAEALAHQVEQDQVRCPRCGCSDWEFERLETGASEPEAAAPAQPAP